MKRAVRTVGILGILYNAFQIIGGSYAAYLYFSVLGTGQLPPIGSVVGVGFYPAIMIAITGLIGLLSSIALVILKEWGFILFYIYTLASGILNWTLSSTILQWSPIFVLIIISIFLIFWERKFFHPILQTS